MKSSWNSHNELKRYDRNLFYYECIFLISYSITSYFADVPKDGTKMNQYYS